MCKEEHPIVVLTMEGQNPFWLACAKQTAKQLNAEQGCKLWHWDKWAAHNQEFCHEKETAIVVTSGT
jgi:hypothetical protein